MSLYHSEQISKSLTCGSVKINPLEFALGAEITCGDLCSSNDAETKFIYQAWLDYLTLLFRGHDINGLELDKSEVLLDEL